uniref:Uncharacterized protein n=1 Tax=Acrobeloides nanus TaxID=290746 RepID=A0A914EC70_9BILA
MDYNLNGTQISQTCTGVLGGPITLDETCTNVTQWGPVDLDSVGCLYVPEIGILPSNSNVTNQTLPSANVTYQNFDQGYPEAIITCSALQGYYACVDFYLNGTQVGQNCQNTVTATWNSQRQWGPVQLDSVGCTYYSCCSLANIPETLQGGDYIYSSSLCAPTITLTCYTVPCFGCNGGYFFTVFFNNNANSYIATSYGNLTPLDVQCVNGILEFDGAVISSFSC